MSLLWIIPSIVFVVFLGLEHYLTDLKPIWQIIFNTIRGAAIAILVTFFVVNKVIEYREQQRWEKVRNTTCSQLVNQICDISAYCAMSYRISIRDKWGLCEDQFPPNNKTLSAFNDLIKDLNKHNINGNIPPTYNKGDYGADMKFYEHVKFNLDHIQMILTPRMIQGHGEQELVDALVDFESAGNKLRDEVFLNYTCFPQVVSLIEKARTVYETIYNDMDK